MIKVILLLLRFTLYWCLPISIENGYVNTWLDRFSHVELHNDLTIYSFMRFTRCEVNYYQIIFIFICSVCIIFHMLAKQDNLQTLFDVFINRNVDNLLLLPYYITIITKLNHIYSIDLFTKIPVKLIKKSNTNLYRKKKKH